MDPKNRPDNCWVYSCFEYLANTSPNPSISSLVHLPKDKSKMTLPPFSVFFLWQNFTTWGDESYKDLLGEKMGKDPHILSLKSSDLDFRV
jgi:hypothetical protein